MKRKTTNKPKKNKPEKAEKTEIKTNKQPTKTPKTIYV